MAIAYEEQLRKKDYDHPAREWSRDKQRRTRPWKAYPSECLSEWKEPPCHEGFIPSSREQSIALNAEIDGVYKNLAALVVQRNPVLPDPGLEERIVHLLQYLKMLQKQEGDLIRARLTSHLAGPIARGWTILKHAEKLMEDYGHSTSTDTPR